MKNWRIYGCILISILLAVSIQANEDWTQWGGPGRDFTLEARELSRDWGEGGPAQIWSRPLGAGFASIVSDGKRLYTTFRDGDDEIVVALDRKSGETIWEYRYAAPVPKKDSLSTEYGRGPNGTPLLTDGKLVTLGFMGHVHCVDAAKGKLLWSHDLGAEYEVETPYFGHATSPLEVGKNAVVVAGGIFAFDLTSGKVAWKNNEFEGSYGSPLLLESGGKRQIVTPVDSHLAGFDPVSGKTLWSQKHKNNWGTILTSPVIDDNGRVFISAAQVGAILVDPAAKSDETRQIWQGDKTQIAHTNAVRDGKLVFSSVGGSASFVTATSLEDGSEVWRARGFAEANFLRVGDSYVVLDFDGKLGLVELNGEGMTVVTEASINDKPNWTPPTLLGTTLYVRDEHSIMALDLSAKTK